MNRQCVKQEKRRYLWSEAGQKKLKAVSDPFLVRLNPLTREEVSEFLSSPGKGVGSDVKNKHISFRPLGCIQTPVPRPCGLNLAVWCVQSCTRYIEGTDLSSPKGRLALTQEQGYKCALAYGGSSQFLT